MERRRVWMIGRGKGGSDDRIVSKGGGSYGVL